MATAPKKGPAARPAGTSLSAQASFREAAAAVPGNQTEEASRMASEIRPRAQLERTLRGR